MPSQAASRRTSFSASRDGSLKDVRAVPTLSARAAASGTPGPWRTCWPCARDHRLRDAGIRPRIGHTGGTYFQYAKPDRRTRDRSAAPLRPSHAPTPWRGTRPRPGHRDDRRPDPDRDAGPVRRRDPGELLRRRRHDRVGQPGLRAPRHVRRGADPGQQHRGHHAHGHPRRRPRAGQRDHLQVAADPGGPWKRPAGHPDVGPHAAGVLPRLRGRRRGSPGARQAAGEPQHGPRRPVDRADRRGQRPPGPGPSRLRHAGSRATATTSSSAGWTSSSSSATGTTGSYAAARRRCASAGSATTSRSTAPPESLLHERADLLQRRRVGLEVGQMGNSGQLDQPGAGHGRGEVPARLEDVRQVVLTHHHQGRH